MNKLLEMTELGDVPEIDDVQPMPAPAWHLLFDLKHPKHDDREELLRHRYLCSGGGLLLCGPTGIGKSSLAMQAMILWAIGRPCFGIEPARPLKSLLIQAENDEGDIAEMRDGIIAGLKLTADEIALARANTIVAREDERTSTRFLLETVEPLLAAHKPDLLWIDPALAYLGGEASSQKDVGGFLRNGLNPLLHKHGCGCVVVHHVNKPPTGRDKPDWKAGDFAYLGSGSAEWANWSRAVLALRSIGSHAVFELRAGKRGGRLGWREADGATKAFHIYIAHATDPGMIYWQEAKPDETEKGGRPKTADVEEVLDLLPPEGLTAGDWQQAALSECGIKESTFHTNRRALRDAKRVVKSKVTNKWQPYLKP